MSREVYCTAQKTPAWRELTGSCPQHWSGLGCSCSRVLHRICCSCSRVLHLIWLFTLKGSISNLAVHVPGFFTTLAVHVPGFFIALGASRAAKGGQVKGTQDTEWGPGYNQLSSGVGDKRPLGWVPIWKSRKGEKASQ